MSAFERLAVQRVLDQAAELGVTVPSEILQSLVCRSGSYGARAWAEQHPNDDREPCCSASSNDPADCTCWTAVYTTAQETPRPLRGPDDLQARTEMCADCAFRKGSPERAISFQEEALLHLTETGEPFWCHDGMRRPDHWAHPDGRVVPGCPDDWQPASLGRIPFRANGSPALLCAGWAALAARVTTTWLGGQS